MKYRVLIVEDNQANSELLSDWLESESFEVGVAENLDLAFASLRNKMPHLILLDVQLGAEDGLILAAQIRQESTMSHIPVIAVTAHAMVTDQERVIQAGCNACISKPIDFRLLRKELQHWLLAISTD
jgi:two-component system, cell cycle response regulator DivK